LLPRDDPKLLHIQVALVSFCSVGRVVTECEEHCWCSNEFTGWATSRTSDYRILW